MANPKKDRPAPTPEQSFKRKVKSIRRVGRLAAEYVLTDDKATAEDAVSLGNDRFGADSVQSRIFASTVKELLAGNYAGR